MKTQSKQDEMKELVLQSIKDGISNHTGEFLNPWLIDGRALSSATNSAEKLKLIQEAILSSDRLTKNIVNLINSEVLSVLEELEKDTRKMHYQALDFVNQYEKEHDIQGEYHVTRHGALRIGADHVLSAIQTLKERYMK